MTILSIVLGLSKIFAKIYEKVTTGDLVIQNMNL